MGRVFYKYPITGDTCEDLGSPVVWRVTPSYITRRVDFKIHYWSQRSLIHKNVAIHAGSWERIILLSAAAPMPMISTLLKTSMTE